MIMIHIFYDLFKCLRILKGFLNAIFQFPSHLQENLEKNSRKLLLFEKHGQILIQL